MEEHAKVGRSQEVAFIGERYLRQWTGNSRMYALLAGACWSGSRWRDCIRYGRLALALNSRLPKTAIFLLAAYRSLDEHRRGIAFGEYWLARFGPDAEVSRHASFLLDDLGRTAEALALARRGLAVAPEDIRLASVVAHYLAKLEGPESALRFAAPYRERFAGEFYCENTLAEGLTGAGAHGEAEKIFARLYSRHPKNPKAFGSLLNVKVQLGKNDEVVAAIKNWQATEMLTGQIANEVGRAWLEKDEPGEALHWMKRASELSPESERYADNYAVVLGKAGHHAECVDACQRRLRLCRPAGRAKLLTTLAIAHTELGQHQEALHAYQEALIEQPNDAEAITNVIVGFNWLERYTDATAFAREHRANKAADLPARFWSELAWAHHLIGDHLAEEETITKWQGFAPDDANVVRTMNRCLNSQRRPEEAREFAEAWTAAHPGNAWGWRHRAEQEFACGHADAEFAAMETACQLAGDDPKIFDFKLVVLRRRDRAEEAYTCGLAWLAAHPNRAHAELINRIGLAADDLERWPEAEKYYQEAHLKEPAAPVWFGNLLRAKIMRQQSAEAVTLGQRWLAEKRWDNYVAGKLAWALREANRRPEETDLLRQALETAPNDEELTYDLLCSLIAQNRTAEAQVLLDRTQEQKFATGRMFNDWGNHLRELRRYDEAETAYRQALVISSDNQTAAGNLAALHTLCGRPEDARIFCNEWLHRRPGDFYVRRQLAHALYTADKVELAEPEYCRLLEREPQSLFLLGRLAACLRLAARHAEVVTLGEEWLRSRPGDAFLHTEIGIALGHLRRPDDAMKNYEQALSYDASWYGAALRKMRLLDEKGELFKAVEFGTEWSAQHEPDADFQNELAILLDRAGQTEKAEQRFRRAIELDDQNPTLAGNAVEILCRRNRISESIQLGQQLLAKSPPNAYLLRRLAEAYSRNHEHLPALDLLESADVLEPADVEVARSFLRIAQEGDETARGIAFGRAWLAREGNERQAGIWSQWARLLFNADQEGAAFEALEKARNLEPEEIRHIRLRFSLLNASGDMSRLIAEYQKLGEEWRHDAALMDYASQAFLDLGLEAEALNLAVENTDANPGDGEVAAWLATLHHKRGRNEKALDWIARWTATHGNHFAMLKVRAVIALAQDRPADALRESDALLAADGSDEDAFVLRIRALRALGRTDEARSKLHQWIEHEKLTPSISRLLDDEPPERA